MEIEEEEIGWGLSGESPMTEEVSWVLKGK